MNKDIGLRVTDDTCLGYCRCPMCGVTAYWSPVAKMHGCADPDCAHQFAEHDDEQLRHDSEDDE